MAASPKKKANKSPQSQLDALLDKYTPERATAGRDCLKKMRARLPGATQLVYDTYNALGIGFGPSEKASEAIFSIVLYPRYVTLFFLQGVHLPDPERLLQGNGRIVRHIKLESPTDLDKPAIRKLMAVALKSAKRGHRQHRPGWPVHQINRCETTSAPSKLKNVGASAPLVQATETTWDSPSAVRRSEAPLVVPSKIRRASSTGQPRAAVPTWFSPLPHNGARAHIRLTYTGHHDLGQPARDGDSQA